MNKYTHMSMLAIVYTRASGGGDPEDTLVKERYMQYRVMFTVKSAVCNGLGHAYTTFLTLLLELVLRYEAVLNVNRHIKS